MTFLNGNGLCQKVHTYLKPIRAFSTVKYQVGIKHVSTSYAALTFVSAKHTPDSPALLKVASGIQLAMPSDIALGSRVLLYREQHLELVLKGEKTLEVRSCCFKPGLVYLGWKGNIWGKAFFGKARVCASIAEYKKHDHLHRWPRSELPYRRTCLIPLLQVERLQPVPFKMKRGAVQIVKFEPLCTV